MLVEVLRDQVMKYREKFEVSMRRVTEVDEQMKRYLGAEMTDPGPQNQLAQGGLCKAFLYQMLL